MGKIFMEGEKEEFISPEIDEKIEGGDWGTKSAKKDE